MPIQQWATPICGLTQSSSPRAVPVEVLAETARKVIKLIDALEDSDDVQNVYSNFDMSAEVMAELEND